MAQLIAHVWDSSISVFALGIPSMNPWASESTHTISTSSESMGTVGVIGGPDRIAFRRRCEARISALLPPAVSGGLMLDGLQSEDRRRGVILERIAGVDDQRAAAA